MWLGTAAGSVYMWVCMHKQGTLCSQRTSHLRDAEVQNVSVLKRLLADVQTLTTTNPEPYCAELYNARELPYGFFSFDLPQLFGKGFPVFFDINLSADEVQTFYQYVEEGLYYDSNTRLGCTELL